MEKIKRFAKNEIGNDYAVGDIHGCFLRLMGVLTDIGFDNTKDRLFSVGDLVDRGPESQLCIKFINKPWFHAVRGNHEQMAIDFHNRSACAYRMSANDYSLNGGDWFLELDDQYKDIYVNVFETLPFMMEVETDKGLIGIIHAEVIDKSWGHSTMCLDLQPTISTNVMLWARDKIRYKDESIITGIDHVVVGHTPTKEPVVLGNVHYIDTGAVFGRDFTILNLNTMEKVN